MHVFIVFIANCLLLDKTNIMHLTVITIFSMYNAPYFNDLYVTHCTLSYMFHNDKFDDL